MGKNEDVSKYGLSEKKGATNKLGLNHRFSSKNSHLGCIPQYPIPGQTPFHPVVNQEFPHFVHARKMGSARPILKQTSNVEGG